MGHEEFRERGLVMENTDHRSLLQPDNRGVRQRSDGRDAQRLPSETPLAEKFAGPEDGHHRLLALRGERGDLDLSFLDVEKRVRRVALREDRLTSAYLRDASACAHAGKKLLRVELAVGAGRHGAPRAVSAIATAGPLSPLPHELMTCELFCTDA